MEVWHLYIHPYIICSVFENTDSCQKNFSAVYSGSQWSFTHKHQVVCWDHRMSLGLLSGSLTPALPAELTSTWETNQDSKVNSDSAKRIFSQDSRFMCKIISPLKGTVQKHFVLASERIRILMKNSNSQTAKRMWKSSLERCSPEDCQSPPGKTSLTNLRNIQTSWIISISQNVHQHERKFSTHPF